jgi:hypothetical protein
MNRFLIAFKATRQLGLRQVGLYALYKFGLLTGHYRRVTGRLAPVPSGELNAIMPMPGVDELLAVLGKDGKKALLAEADEIAGGKVRLFGADPVLLELSLPGNLAHWTAYETGKVPFPVFDAPARDIKFLWEPARFGWAFTIGRAYLLTKHEKYAEAFWHHFEIFDHATPPFLGPHWMSGQEVALRLMAFIWAGQVFDTALASTPERKSRLAASVAEHAARIPPTLVYARSQHNNHLLTEAAGLLSAGLALPNAPDGLRWRSLGWRWLNAGFQSQIDNYGEYSQHSTNYHRLMLEVALWTQALIGNNHLGPPFHWPRQTLGAIDRSVHWLLALLDSESGRVPNIGANDGAYIFPLSNCPFEDFRPVLYAVARAFLDYNLPPGPWDEMSLWFDARAGGPRSVALPRYLGDQLYGKQSWAYFRTAQFNSRPSHADQLHLDLWWHGLNLAQDAGTYLYNAESPWDNTLSVAFVHNTVTVNDRDQMTRAGRFLYLDWVNAYRKDLSPDEPGELQRVRGRYRVRGYRHTRTVSVFEDDHWQVLDEILPLRGSRQKQRFTARLHWLLQDWDWEIENSDSGVLLRLASPCGPVRLTIHYSASAQSSFSLFRAGELLVGSAVPDPTRGWTSPTYAVKIPALSLAVKAESDSEIVFSTGFTFPPIDC